jgi:hypothetical protein
VGGVSCSGVQRVDGGHARTLKLEKREEGATIESGSSKGKRYFPTMMEQRKRPRILGRCSIGNARNGIE